MVVGRVYNGDDVFQEKLPGGKDRSSLTSQTSPSRDSANEIRFEDKKGEEQIFIHGEKNMDVRVKNDVFQNIGRHTNLDVVEDQYQHIGKDSHLTVDQEVVEKIGRDHHATIRWMRRSLGLTQNICSLQLRVCLPE